MMTFAKALRLCVALFIAGIGFANAFATTVIPPTFEEMTDRAEVIFVGKVVSLRSEWRGVGTQRAIFTLVEFEKTETLKGDPGRSITLQFLGGTVGEATLEVGGVPKFKVGDRELLFVAKNGVQVCPIVGVFHGKFGVRKDQKSGRDFLVRHNGKELRNVAEIGAGEPGAARASLSAAGSAEPLSLDDFKEKIRGRVAAGAKKK
ncbi:MAG TPA: hypothetical protein VM680_19600 [Verrucomicrobiae bacterium]|nr:hypothetical protein [Verrucomicrobiae bacterium]